jgi:hypothetical protein
MPCIPFSESPLPLFSNLPSLPSLLHSISFVYIKRESKGEGVHQTMYVCPSEGTGCCPFPAFTLFTRLHSPTPFLHFHFFHFFTPLILSLISQRERLMHPPVVQLQRTKTALTAFTPSLVQRLDKRLFQRLQQFSAKKSPNFCLFTACSRCEALTVPRSVCG